MKWLNFPFRLIYTIYGVLLFLIISILGISLILLLYNIVKKYYHEKLKTILQTMSDLWLCLTLNKLVIEGSEHVNHSIPAVIVGNHSSTLDMFTCMSGIPYTFKALGKEELNSYPVLNIMFRTLVIFIDRSNAESRAKGVEKCRKVLRGGTSIFIMPEGTRNRTQEPLLPFKEGAFRLAIETQTPIQPFVLLDCRLVYPMWSWMMLRPGIMKLKFLPRIEVHEMKMEDVEKLKNHVFKQIEEVILKEDKYFRKSTIN
jgi:1-acyl-sn-glycerol-3-phosphate acyltransferase